DCRRLFLRQFRSKTTFLRTDAELSPRDDINDESKANMKNIHLFALLFVCGSTSFTQTRTVTSPVCLQDPRGNCEGPLSSGANSPTAGAVDQILYAGSGVTPTIDTQITACGPVNPCQIIVTPDYTGTFPPVNTVTNNIVITDLHAPGPFPAPLGSNTVTWNGQ